MRIKAFDNKERAVLYPKQARRQNHNRGVHVVRH